MCREEDMLANLGVWCEKGVVELGGVGMFYSVTTEGKRRENTCVLDDGRDAVEKNMRRECMNLCK